MQEPTPSFNSQKQVSVSGMDQTQQVANGRHNARKRQQAQVAGNSSQNPIDQDFKDNNNSINDKD